uniref:Uncharacterized protein n=1 Tax=Glossina pallidipes TaxID=7398 RepID=A0A1A9ZZJ9_GLOPL
MDIDGMDILIRLDIRNMDIHGLDTQTLLETCYMDIHDMVCMSTIGTYSKYGISTIWISTHDMDVQAILDIQRMLHIRIRDLHDTNILTVLDIRDVHIQKMGILITDSYNIDTHDMDILTPLNEHSFLFEPNLISTGKLYVHRHVQPLPEIEKVKDPSMDTA